MSEPHDQDPDPAALDELLRAFGESPDESGDSGEHDVVPSLESADDSVVGDESVGEEPTDESVDDDSADDEPADAADEPAELLIVEQEPMVAPVDPTPTPPTVIRIDDYGGSVVVADTSESTPAAKMPPVSTQKRSPDDEPADSRTDADAAGTVVISIEDEDLPDAVYVDGALDGEGKRTIVFIEDDETGDTVAPDVERDTRRGIEPRLRERRAAVKRAIGRKRLRWVLLGTLVVVVGVGALALLGSGLFAIKAENVEVYGAVYADQEQVDAVVDDLVGTPALRADTKAAEDALEEIPWVAEARVRVSFPGSATIEIREREAWTTYQGPDGRYRVLDRDGRVLAVLDGYPIAYLLLDGPDAVDLDAGAFAPQGYAAASELAKNLTSSIRGQVSFVSITADGSSLTIFLDDGTEIRFGAARDLFNKLLRLETALSNNPDLEPGVIDVSTSEVTF